jgi:hypothetical protein
MPQAVASSSCYIPSRTFHFSTHPASIRVSRFFRKFSHDPKHVFIIAGKPSLHHLLAFIWKGNDTALVSYCLRQFKICSFARQSRLSRSQSLPLDHNPAGQTRTVVRFERVNGAIWQSTSGIL